MKPDLLFEFTLDKPKKMVYITREFDAPLSLVWDAFTKPEILDQWWAPKPMKSETKSMNFEVGGRRFYAMVGPGGEKRWPVQKYTLISPTTHFKMLNAFADENENPELPGSEWDLRFSEQRGKTRVDTTIYNESLERLEMMLEAFRAGFTATLQSLEELLESRPQQSLN